jgi:chromosome partitioning protein
MTITISSWKGGTGKTTLAVLLAIMLAARKMRILIIDLDSNCAISQVFGQVLKDYSSMDFLSGTGENFKGVYPAKEQIDPESFNKLSLQIKTAKQPLISR